MAWIGPGGLVLFADETLAWTVVGVWWIALFGMAYWIIAAGSRALSIVGVVAAGVWPLMLPAEPGPMRLYVAGYAVVYAIKMWERGAGRVVDERCWADVAHFFVWWMLPPDHRWPRSQPDRCRNRRRGWRRALRGLVALGALMAMMVLAGSMDVHVHWIGSTVWSLLVIYGFVAAIADGVCGLAMIAGLDVAEVFRAPIVAQSPSDFWARRWNRYINEFARRYIFFSCTELLGVRGAAVVVFLASGLMHEYLIVMWNGGVGSYTGWTMAFFLVQGGGVVAAHVFAGGRRWSRALGVAAHVSWMVLTTPLFFRPLDEAIGFTSWAIVL